VYLTLEYILVANVVIKTLQDCQTAFNTLFAWYTRMTTSPQNCNGFRITNVGAGQQPNDVAIMSQLPIIPSTPTPKKKYYTLIWNSVGAVSVGSAVCPTDYIGKDRTGYPIQVWMGATIPPTTGPLAMNFLVNGNQLMPNNITANPGDQLPVVSSTFNLPAQKLGYLMSVLPIVASAGGASLVSIGLVVQLDA
jgi:hypothetical protein